VSQQPHFRARAAAADISDGLAAGNYLAQVRGSPDATHFFVEYASAASAPTTAQDYFQAGIGESFVFEAGEDCPPTWVRVSPETLTFVADAEIAVAIARVTA